MALSQAILQTLHECSRDEASYERLVAHMTDALQEKNTELEHFFAITPDLWCIADTDGNFLKLSPMWEVTMGYSLAELHGQRFLDFVHPDDLQSTLEALAVLNSQVPIVNFTNRYRHKDGSYRFIEWRSQPDGKLIYAAARDVTERRHMENAMRESEARYRAIVTTMTEGIVVQGADGSIQTCNAAAEQILGLSAEQMAGVKSVDPRWRAIHEDYTPFPGETHPAMVSLQTGKSVSNVVMGVHKPDDSLSWILVNAQPIFKLGESCPSQVITSFANITPIRAMSHAVQESEARLRSIFETIDDAVWSVELPSRKMIYLNPAGERILGRPFTDFYEDNTLSASIIHAEDISMVLDSQNMLVKDGRMTWEYRIVRPDGEIRWIHNRAWLVKDDQGNPTRIEGIFSDTTTRRVIEAQALELVVERERTRLLSDFINNTSHELRTPLTAISMGVYLMTRITDPELRKEKATQVEREIMYLNQIIQQLHNMAKLDGIQHLETTQLDVNTLVNDCVLEVRPRKADITLVTELAEESLKIMANREYFHRAVAHLLDNAIQFSSEGGIIAIRTLLQDGDVVVEVEDQGTGIPAEHLDHVFERFYKVDPARPRTEAGVGMGLAFVKQIMRLHNGRVTVQSVPGQGSTFRLHFPRA